MLESTHLWHPFTQAQTAPAPLPVARASGAFLYTQDGRKIFDAISSWWVITHGHCHPKLAETLARQAQTLDQVIFAGCTHEPAQRLAAALCAQLPDTLQKVFFADNGSSAVEVALKMALQYWQNHGQPQRTRIAALQGGYHGDTFGAMAAGHSSGFFAPFADKLFAVDFLPAALSTMPRDDKSPLTDSEQQAIAAAKKYAAEQHNTLAAFILEPMIQGASGMRMMRPLFVRTLVETLRATGALIIFDEIMTGFGRTGTLFALQQVGSAPDLLCLSKGLTGGTMPLSVTIATDTIFEAFKGEDFHRAFAHGHSFTANPIACAVALKALELFTDENTLSRIATLEQAHHHGLASLPPDSIENPRVCGAIAAFEIPSPTSGYHAPIGALLRQTCLQEGILLRPLGNTVYLLPPYCTDEETLEKTYRTIREWLHSRQNTPQL